MMCQLEIWDEDGLVDTLWLNGVPSLRENGIDITFGHKPTFVIRKKMTLTKTMLRWGNVSIDLKDGFQPFVLHPGDKLEFFRIVVIDLVNKL